LDYIKKVEKVYLMVTGLAKWLRKKKKERKGREIEEKESYTGGKL
jgi:hypothetical protein